MISELQLKKINSKVLSRLRQRALFIYRYGYSLKSHNYYLYDQKSTFKVHSLYALQLYSSGLSLRKISERLLPFIKRNHVSIWNWIQEYKAKESIAKEEKEDRILIVDETLIKISNQFVWIWIAVIDSTDKIILGVHISIERTMLIAE